MKKIVLASGSPRRREMMRQAGLEFEVHESSVEETHEDGNAEDMVMRLSMEKAADVSEYYPEDCIIVGADTTVVIEGHILGKPADEEDAARMLGMLQGRTHQVFTGVTILDKALPERTVTNLCERTDVTFYPMTEESIRRYINTKEPLGKAGSYGIQGLGIVFVKSICGDYNNVVGLPVSAIRCIYEKAR